MARVVLSRLARRDLEDLWLYVATHDMDAADRMSERIERQLRMLARYPDSAPLRPDIGLDVRALVVERWLVLYRRVEDDVQIGRIVDGARDLKRVGWPGDI